MAFLYSDCYMGLNCEHTVYYKDPIFRNVLMVSVPLNFSLDTLARGR